MLAFVIHRNGQEGFLNVFAVVTWRIVQCTRTLAQMNRTDSSRCLIGLCLVPLEMETSTVNSEYCLSKTMRPHPLTLPTVTPLTVPSMAAQSEQCVRVLNRETVNLPASILRLWRGGEKGRGGSLFMASYSFFHAPVFPPPHPPFLRVKATRHPWPFLPAAFLL